MACMFILEDDEGRVERFRRALASIAPDVKVHVWASVKSMIAEHEEHLADVCLISLDHDLYPRERDGADPGDGWEVAQLLATQLPVCPVIVHTSNSERARWMVGELELAHWNVRTVAPFDDDWIETHWASVVRKLLKPES